MKFVHSFWSKPLFNNKFNTYQELLPVILTDYAYSTACIKAHGHTIRLFTDKKGAEMLGFIPYDNIVIVDNLENENIHFAAQIKFEALSNMTLDEILIDGDLFIQQPEAFERIQSLNSDLVYSFYEPPSFTIDSEKRVQYYEKMLDILYKYKEYFTPPFTLDRDVYVYSWPNTSLMKFNSGVLKNKYIEQYELFKHTLSNENFEDVWPDIIIEQRHMDKLLRYYNFSYTPVIENFPEPQANEYAINIGYTHLGAGKIYYQQNISERLKKLNPELHEKTQAQIEKFLLYIHE